MKKFVIELDAKLFGLMKRELSNYYESELDDVQVVKELFYVEVGTIIAFDFRNEVEVSVIE